MSMFAYGGKSFPVNPASFTIEHRRAHIRTPLPNGGELFEDMGLGPRVVTGTGMLYGDDLSGQYEALKADFLTAGKAQLTVAGLAGFPAWCTRLAVTGQPDPDTLTFAFEFVEDLES